MRDEKDKACEGHLTKRGTEWVFSFDEGTRYGQFSSWMTSLISFCLFIFKEIDLPAAHQRFAERDKWCVVHCALWIVRDKWCVSLTGGIWSTHDQGTQSINIFWNEFNLKSWSLKHTCSRYVTSRWYSPVLQTSTLRLVVRISFWWIAFDILLGRYSEIATTITAKLSHVQKPTI